MIALNIQVSFLDCFVQYLDRQTFKTLEYIDNKISE